MRYLKGYGLFESSDGLTEEQRKFLDKYTRGTWSVNSEGFVDIEGKFLCGDQKLKDFLGIRFGKVSDDFWCYDNQLTTLEGCPREISGSFFCHRNQLTTLEGCPREVREHFFCFSNQLKTLKGSPSEVGGYFWCGNNQLKTLEGAPRIVGGSFKCQNQNGQLKTLEGAPETVGDFHCENNQLTTLEGSPRKVGDFHCENNQLRTLEGCPREVSGTFYCSGNPLISIEEASEVVKKGFYFRDRFFRNNLEKFLDMIDSAEPDEISLLLTHRFFTPEVIEEQINENPKFTYYVSLVWNTEGFKKTQDELKKILPENKLVEIKDLKALRGYL